MPSQLVEKACRQYSAAVAEGRDVQIEELLRGLPESERAEVFSALLKLDLQRMLAAGQGVDLAPYLQRFPNDRSLVEQVANELALAGNQQSDGDVSLTDTIALLEIQEATGRHDAGDANPPPPTAWSADSAPPFRIGRFEVLTVLGRGGFGTVYKAFDPKLERPVAIKVPRAELLAAPKDLERFLREARAAAALNHPNICPVHDVGELDSLHYIVMAYIEGTSLSGLLKQRGVLAQADAVRMVSAVARALHLAHQRGIVHRDLKPSNIMIDADGKPVVMDFGLAVRNASNDPRLTYSGAIVGTPSYMSPEQMRGDSEVGPASDIYSLGVVLYELVTGQRPFGGKTVADVIAAALSGTATPPSALTPGVSDQMDAICAQAMAKNPGDRFASMLEFAAALEKLSPEFRRSDPARVGQRATRSKRVAIAAIGVLVACVGLLGMLIWGRQNEPLANHRDAAVIEPNDRMNVKGVSTEVRSPESALLFDGRDDYVELPKIDLEPLEPLTLEAWVTPTQSYENRPPSPFAQGHIFGWENLEDLVLCAFDNALGATLNPIRPTGDNWVVFLRREGLQLGQRQHLALTLSNGTEASLFVDGKRIQSKSLPRPIDARTWPPTIGALVHPLTVKEQGPDRAFAGQIDEVRISNTIRYTTAFEPGDPFEKDPQTIALYHLNEGSGQIVHDDSGHQFHGTIHGAEWVQRQPLHAVAPFDRMRAEQLQQDWAEYLGLPAQFENSLGIQFRILPPGEFTMGAPKSEDRSGGVARAILTESGKAIPFPYDEFPHRIRIPQAQYVGVHEVTRSLFAKFVEAQQYKTDAERDPHGGFGYRADARRIERSPDFNWRETGFLQADDHPVVNVSWNDAQAFCQWLSDQDGRRYRLPTEAEWEYACRAGTVTRFSTGNDAADLQQVANIADLSYGNSVANVSWYQSWNDGHPFTAPVGQFAPNPFGLCDLHGNVWELCDDRYAPDYSLGLAVDQQLASLGLAGRVKRGGAFAQPPALVRSAQRWSLNDSDVYCDQGFRIVLTINSMIDEKGPAIDTTDTESAGASSFVETLASAAQAGQYQQQWAEEHNLDIDTENSIGITLRLIPPAEFVMGAPPNDASHSGFTARFMGPNGANAVELRHPVRLTRGFYLASTEVTVGQFRQFVEEEGFVTDVEKHLIPGQGYDADGMQLVRGEQYSWRNTGFDQTEDDPVVNVSWLDADAFCKWLTSREGETYRLPTEAEWEFACRAGTSTRFHCGDDPQSLEGVANVRDSAFLVEIPKERLFTVSWNDGFPFTAPVASFAANAFGLYDMHGNVWEWCSDWFQDDYYRRSPVNDPRGPSAGRHRTARGGAFDADAMFARSATRYPNIQVAASTGIGFRVVRELGETDPAEPDPPQR